VVPAAVIVPPRLLQLVGFKLAVYCTRYTNPDTVLQVSPMVLLVCVTDWNTGPGWVSR
jgi:hypothetical protein